MNMEATKGMPAYLLELEVGDLVELQSCMHPKKRDIAIVVSIRNGDGWGSYATLLVGSCLTVVQLRKVVVITRIKDVP